MSDEIRRYKEAWENLFVAAGEVASLMPGEEHTEITTDPIGDENSQHIGLVGATLSEKPILKSALAAFEKAAVWGYSQGGIIIPQNKVVDVSEVPGNAAYTGGVLRENVSNPDEFPNEREVLPLFAIVPNV